MSPSICKLQVWFLDKFESVMYRCCYGCFSLIFKIYGSVIVHFGHICIAGFKHKGCSFHHLTAGVLPTFKVCNRSGHLQSYRFRNTHAKVRGLFAPASRFHKTLPRCSCCRSRRKYHVSGYSEISCFNIVQFEDVEKPCCAAGCGIHHFHPILVVVRYLKLYFKRAHIPFKVANPKECIVLTSPKS